MLRLLQAFAIALLAATALLAPPNTAKTQDQGASAGAPPATTAPTVSAVTVNGARAKVESSIDRRSYSIANDLNAQTGSVADVLRNIPAVQIDAQGNPSLQGEGDVTVLIDGKPSSQFDGSNLGQALQAMSADRIDRIEVMTNPPAEFRAEGTGGIINLVTKKAKGAGWTGSARISAESHGGTSTTVNLGYNSDRLSVIGDVTYRRSLQTQFDRLDLSQADPATGLPVSSQDVDRKRWINDRWQAHAGADYDLDNRTRLSGSARLSTSRYDSLYRDQFVQGDIFGNPVSVLDRTSREHWIFNSGDASLSWRRTYGEGHDLTFNADFSGTETDGNRTDRLAPALPVGQAASSQRVVWTDLSERARLTADYEQPLSGGQLKLGYDFEYAPNRIDQAGGSGAANGPIPLDPSQHDVFLDNETDNAAYVSYERQLGKVTLLAGLRAEDARFALEQQTQGIETIHDYPRLFPNLHLAYDLGNGRQLTASYSWRTNRPNDRQLDPFATSLTPLYLQSGNPNLKPDDQSRYELGFEDRRGDRTMTVTLYYHHRRDAFNLLYSNLPDGVYLQQTVNAGQGRTAGAEWSVSDKLTPKISYGVSLDGYWIQLATAPSLGFPQTRSAVTGFGHASLTWRITPGDLLQFDLSTTAEGLQPQGYSLPTHTGNIGYRHAINAKASWMLVVQDPFHTLRYRAVENINGVESRRFELPSSQSISLAIVWSFAGKPKDEGFDFGSGGGGR